MILELWSRAPEVRCEKEHKVVGAVDQDTG
jgi:hypothetical protein